jgi:hypothetical protein
MTWPFYSLEITNDKGLPRHYPSKVAEGLQKFRMGGFAAHYASIVAVLLHLSSQEGLHDIVVLTRTGHHIHWDYFQPCRPWWLGLEIVKMAGIGDVYRAYFNLAHIAIKAIKFRPVSTLPK